MPANFNWARGKNEPYNRAGMNNSMAFGVEEGDLGMVEDDGSGNLQVVEADATSGEPTLGMFIGETTDLSQYPEDDAFGGYYHRQVKENAMVVGGERVTLFQYGVEMKNDGDDIGITPGEPVYLAEGGGYTTTAPSTSGSVVQIVGRGLPEDEDGKERFQLEVQIDYTTVA